MSVREEFGFRRNVCACRKCSLWCEYVPGALVPSDLERLIPSGDDPFLWAEDHLLASPGFRMMNGLGETLIQIPTLVPMRQENAFVSQCQQTPKQAEPRIIAARLAREKAFQEGHLYAQIWNRLWDAGLKELNTLENTDRALQEVQRLNTAEVRHKHNAQKKAKKKAKKKLKNKQRR